MSNSTAKAHSARASEEKREWMFGRVLDLLIQYNFIVIFLVLVIVASLLSADFLTIQNVANLFQQATIVGVVAVGMTFVILTANIDLSVGSVVALGGMVVAVLLKAGVPPFLAGCLTVLTGAVLGFGMGAIRRRRVWSLTRLPPLCSAGRACLEDAASSWEPLSR